MRARFIVRGGVRWSIGTGNTIPILGEPWLLNEDIIASDIVGAHYVHHATVDNLMLSNEKRWNETEVIQVFSAELADKIMSTPLVTHVQSDHLVWQDEKNEKYYVKSAYHLCVEELIDSSHLRRTGKWSIIWKLKTPPRIQNLLWRLCRGC